MKKALSWIAAALAVAAVAAWAALPSLVRREAEREVAKLGFTAKVGTARLELWKILLGDVEATRGTTRVRVKKAEVDLEGWFRPKEVRLEGAEVDMQEGRESGSPKGREGPSLRVTARDSTVRWRSGGVSVTAKIREAERDAEGLLSAVADVEAEAPWGRASVKGAHAKKLKAGSPAHIVADSLRVEAKEVAPASAKDNAGEGRKIPEVTLDVRIAEIEVGGAKAELRGATLSNEGGKNEVRAESASVAGMADIEKLRAAVRRTEGGLEFDASAATLETRSERLSKGEFAAKSVAARGSLRIGPEGVSVPASTLQLGQAEVAAEASYDRSRLHIAAEMAEVGCQELLESIPRELVPKLVPGTLLTGTAAWKLEVTVDLPERKKPSVSIWMKNRCAVKQVPEALRISRIRKPFKREVYASDGSKREVVSGPGTESWVPWAGISHYLPAAIRTMEDPGFLAHRGILIEAFENSMEQNITAGRFVRGGSTITMQLAKNLWLAREKTLSRKMQEAVLTLLLEKELSKQEILEYYMNCVEFGPDIYGVKAAAARYFSKSPAALSLSQSLFLASILPSPRRAQFGPDGKLGGGRLALIRKMMGNMLERRLITQAQHDAGLREVPVLGEPSSGGPEEEIVTEEGGLDPGEWR